MNVMYVRMLVYSIMCPPFYVCTCRPNLFLEVRAKSDHAVMDLRPILLATKDGSRYMIGGRG